VHLRSEESEAMANWLIGVGVVIVLFFIGLGHYHYSRKAAEKVLQGVEYIRENRQQQG
jgi:hypothetical protein